MMFSRLMFCGSHRYTGMRDRRGAPVGSLLEAYTHSSLANVLAFLIQL